jgi:PPOX class probable F420-dependent enzyme
MIPETVRAVVESGAAAHLVTLEPDGSPQISLVWVGIEDDEIVSAHLSSAQRKLVNVGRDPRVALSLETGVRNQMGLDEYLVVHGTGRITDGGAPELLQRLARTYLGEDVTFPPMPNPPPGHILRITPTRFAGVGPWAG